MAAQPWTEADSIELQRLHAENVPLNQISKRMKRSRSTISTKAKQMGLSFDRSKMEAAIAANVVDVKERRARIQQKLLDRAEYLVDLLDAPRTGGTYRALVPVGQGEQRTRELDHIPSSDERNTANSIAAYMSQANAIEKMMSDGGMAEAKGMVGSILAAIRGSVAGEKRLNPAEDGGAK